MTDVQTSLEGKIIIIKYTESDYDSESEACLVYKVIEGKPEPLLGVLSLPDTSHLSKTDLYLPDADEEALEVIQGQGVTEVYCPQWGGNNSFLNFKMGTSILSNVTNRRGELVDWVDLDSFYSQGTEILALLKKNGIKVFYFDNNTLGIVAEEE